jgi:hypothetical protein
MTAIGAAWIVRVTVRHREALQQESRREHAKPPRAHSATGASSVSLEAPTQTASAELAAPSLPEPLPAPVEAGLAATRRALGPHPGLATPAAPVTATRPIVETILVPATPLVRQTTPAPIVAPPTELAAVGEPPAPTSASTAAHAALVLSARVALRHDRDPRAALRLVEQYLRENPDGPVVEEALALSIEARTALGDRRAAATAAENYLSHFPTGRFVDLANRTKSVAHP